MDYIGRGLTFRDADGTLGCPTPNVALTVPEKNAANPAAGVLLGAWLLLYAWRTVVGHLSLATNAFDLSVFDYALWSLEHGGGGFVPFLGHSIFSHHFMPISWVLAPVHALSPVTLTLLLVQLVAAAGAAVLFLRLQRQQGLDHWLALGLMLVFLLSRRTHGGARNLRQHDCAARQSAGRLDWSLRLADPAVAVPVGLGGRVVDAAPFSKTRGGVIALLLDPERIDSLVAQYRNDAHYSK